MTDKQWAPWQERVFDEREELSKKIDKLSLFASPHEPAFVEMSINDRELLFLQLEAMHRYYMILVRRIMGFAR